jgi:hypothetical protein
MSSVNIPLSFLQPNQETRALLLNTQQSSQRKQVLTLAVVVDLVLQHISGNASLPAFVNDSGVICYPRVNSPNEITPGKIVVYCKDVIFANLLQQVCLIDFTWCLGEQN